MKRKNLAECTRFFITATIAEWRPLLAEPPARDILLRDLEFYRAKYGCKFGLRDNAGTLPFYHRLSAPGGPAQVVARPATAYGNEIAKRPRDTALPEEPATYARHANGTSNLAVWKEQARALGIISDAVMRTKIDYAHNNPVKRNLVDDPSLWPWSSWRNYCLDDDSVFVSIGRICYNP